MPGNARRMKALKRQDIAMPTLSRTRRQTHPTMPEVQFITSISTIPENASFVLVMFGAHGQQTRHGRGFTVMVARTQNPGIDEIALQHAIEAARLIAERNQIDRMFVYE